MKYKIVFDSTVYLPQELLDKHNIGVASLNVVNGVDSYREVDVDVPFIFDMQDKGASWTTSQPAPGEFLDIYDQAFEDGYDFIFVMGLSSQISGTYQSSVLAKNMSDRSDDIYTFDTQLCAYGTEMIGLRLIDLVTQKLDKDVIIEKLNVLIKQSGQMFVTENLISLVKGGRLSAPSAYLGTLLRIKPIIKVIDGKLQLNGKERTYKKTNKFIIDTMNNEIGEHKNLYVYITDTHSFESGETLKEAVLEAFPNAIITRSSYLGPVFSVHVGKKGYGLSWCYE